MPAWRTALLASALLLAAAAAPRRAAAADLPVADLLAGGLCPEISALIASSHKTFAAALDALAGAGAALSVPDGPLELLLPTDAAFAALFKRAGLTPAAALAQPNVLEDLVNEHLAIDVSAKGDGSKLETLSGSALTVKSGVVGNALNAAKLSGPAAACAAQGQRARGVAAVIVPARYADWSSAPPAAAPPPPAVAAAGAPSPAPAAAASPSAAAASPSAAAASPPTAAALVPATAPALAPALAPTLAPAPAPPASLLATLCPELQVALRARSPGLADAFAALPPPEPPLPLGAVPVVLAPTDAALAALLAAAGLNGTAAALLAAPAPAAPGAPAPGGAPPQLVRAVLLNLWTTAADAGASGALASLYGEPLAVTVNQAAAAVGAAIGAPAGAAGVGAPGAPAAAALAGGQVCSSGAGAPAGALLYLNSLLLPGEYAAYGLAPAPAPAPALAPAPAPAPASSAAAARCGAAAAALLALAALV
jgi:hypothetical protein